LKFDRSSSAAFATVAESYERRRPTYPADVVKWLAGRLGLGAGATVVDVGAGTGKLTRDLVPTGARVIAVEPLAEMRRQLATAVPAAEVLAGSAEELPLADDSADAVVAASAFHWFDPERALPEIHRVLRPGGGLATVGNGRDLDDPLQQEIQAIVSPYVPAAGELLSWIDVVDASPLFGSLEEFSTTHEQWFDAEGLAERMGTVSYIARLPDEERADVLARLRRLGGAQPRSPFAFRYRTRARVCQAVTATTL
jgi:ubiquinone/menaquinone biosynthesis C-methylase UbiE